MRDSPKAKSLSAWKATPPAPDSTAHHCKSIAELSSMPGETLTKRARHKPQTQWQLATAIVTALELVLVAVRERAPQAPIAATASLPARQLPSAAQFNGNNRSAASAAPDVDDTGVEPYVDDRGAGTDGKVAAAEAVKAGYASDGVALPTSTPLVQHQAIDVMCSEANAALLIRRLWRERVNSVTAASIDAGKRKLRKGEQSK